MSKLCAQWEAIKWDKVRFRVSRYQRRIYKASFHKQRGKVRFLQKQLISSLDAKLYAVQHVTTWNGRKHGLSADEKVYKTAAEKMSLVKKLRLDQQACSIPGAPKSGKAKKRPLFKLRAKQALCLLALEPEWEARFEPNSYGFRPGRSCHDAMEAIFLALDNKHSHHHGKHVLKVNLRKCFDPIDHDFLLSKLDTLPEINAQILNWLKTGMVQGFIRENLPSTVSLNTLDTFQGDMVSPFLANIALHGLEVHLKQWIGKQPKFGGCVGQGVEAKRTALSVVRYADDFIVIHPSRETLELVKRVMIDWLKPSGLGMDEEKTSIVSATQGFEFLGFRVIMVKRNGLLRYKAYPALSSQKKLTNKVSNIIQSHKAASAYELITKLRPVILGWANYYCYCQCQSSFSKLTHKIFLKLRAWVFRRDTRNGRREVKERYFPSGKTYVFEDTKHNDNWVLNGQPKAKDHHLQTAWLPNMSWVKSKKWVQVKGESSVYDGNDVYWTKRDLVYGSWIDK